MTTTRSRKQTSHAAFSCPTHLMALHGFNFSQQHIAEPVTNAAAWFSCTPWQIFNEDLQAKGCIVGEGVDGLTWFIHRKPSAFQGLHETAAGSISTFCPLPESNTELYCYFPYFPHKLFPLHMLQSSFVFSTSRSLERGNWIPPPLCANCSSGSREGCVPSTQTTWSYFWSSYTSILQLPMAIMKNSTSPPEQVNNYSDIHKSAPSWARPALQCSHCRKTTR